MTNTTSIPLPSLNNRICSVDIMRGLTILVMAFVNDLADFFPVKGVPQWLRHMASGVDSLTFVDMIIPFFIFVMGISIPLALGRRLERNESTVKVLGHVLLRSISLIMIGLMDVNRNGYDTMGWPKGLWKFLAWSFIFIVWLEFPLTSRRKIFIHRIARIAGLAGLIWLAVVFRDSNGTFRTSWWGTLGKVGWTYLFASLIFLIVRNNRVSIIGVFVLIHCAFIGMKNGILHENWLVGFLGMSTIGTYLACAVAGLSIGTLLIGESSYKENIRWALGLAFFTGTASIFLRPIGGLHLPSTSWSLFSTSCAVVIWVLLYWCIDIRGWSTGLGHIRTIGKNSLLFYQLTRYWVWLYWLTGLTFYDTLAENTAIGIIRAIVYTLFISVITVFVAKKRVRLRV